MIAPRSSAARIASSTAGSWSRKSYFGARQTRSASSVASSPRSTTRSKSERPPAGPGRGVQTWKSKTGVSSSGWYGSPHTSTSEPSPNGSAPSCTITATFFTGPGADCGMDQRASWQKINVRWLFCHSWQDHDGGMITAMTFLMILLVIAAI